MINRRLRQSNFEGMKLNDRTESFSSCEKDVVPLEENDSNLINEDRYCNAITSAQDHRSLSFRFQAYFLSKLLATKTRVSGKFEKENNKRQLSYCHQRYNWQTQNTHVKIAEHACHSNNQPINSFDVCDIPMRSQETAPSPSGKAVPSFKFTDSATSGSLPHRFSRSPKSLCRSEDGISGITSQCNGCNPVLNGLTFAKTSKTRHKPSIFCSASRTNLTTSLHVVNIIFLLQIIALLVGGTSAVWWSPGSRSSLVSTQRICSWARQIGGTQAETCDNHQPVIAQIEEGIELGMEQCQDDFRRDRWNCTQLKRSYFASLLKQDVRETAYVQAITAAAVTYQITAACARGDIEGCGCTNAAELKNDLLVMEAKKHNVSVSNETLQRAVDQFNWGGCHDNVDYGYQKSRDFLNTTGTEISTKRNGIDAAVTYHNQEAGRLAIKKYQKRRCKCHGLCGSCTMWTCWDRMPRFQEVGRRLRQRYGYAIRVRESNDGQSLEPVKRYEKRMMKRRPLIRRARSVKKRRKKKRKRSRNPTSRKPLGVRRNQYRRLRRELKIGPEDLIFVQNSPNFCNRSKKQGSLGTQGRICDPSKRRGIGSCNYMCCGRRLRREVVTEKCNCKLQKSLNLVCQECVRKRYRCR
ncbi:protein Wnt-6-like isoform X1 [Clavelina lepadiformis]|uniref:protein Wnt-6-like isoform X1 n=1 Tax=Clavelina lepadiformis TaxID=159417 RepID=UPI0040428AD0